MFLCQDLSGVNKPPKPILSLMPPPSLPSSFLKQSPLLNILHSENSYFKLSLPLRLRLCRRSKKYLQWKLLHKRKHGEKSPHLFLSMFGAFWAKISSFYLCVGSLIHCNSLLFLFLQNQRVVVQSLQVSQYFFFVCKVGTS